MIAPTIGRMVHVWKNGAYLDGAIVQVDQPLSGQIVYVHTDRMINVAGFDANGDVFRLTSVALMQDGDAKPDGGQPYAEWMPFQKGQAGKTDTLGVALVAKVDALDAALAALEAKLAAIGTPVEMPPPNPPGTTPAA